MANKSLTNEELDRLAGEYRYIITDLMYRAGGGHLGGALSIVEIVITLYYRIMNFRADDPNWRGRDRLVLSKGHAGPTLYTALALNGFFPAQWLPTLNANGTNLPSHVDHNLTPGIDMTCGSLAQGFSAAAGMALAAKKDGAIHRVFAIIGDGESNEGQIWEAAMFASHNKLDNLVAICDRNQWQIDGSSNEVLNINPLPDKWTAFGWEVFEIDGHDWDALYTTILTASDVQDKPAMIIANTIKGRDCGVIEDTMESHSVHVATEEEHATFMNSLRLTDYELPYTV